MRKVLVVLMSLMISAVLISCSEDETTVTPTPTPADLEITTDSALTSYVCEPINMDIEAVHGTAPYSWDVADGSDPLPTGITMTSEGTISGVLETTGEWTFTLECTDSADPTEAVSREFTLTVSEKSNPSLGVFFDEGGEDCSSTTTAFSTLDCYVYLMLADQDPNNCAQACEFKLCLKNSDGVELEAGTDYAIVSADYNDYASVVLGDMLSGVSMGFSRPMYGPTVSVATFGLILFEDLSNLNFEFEAVPDGYLAITQCDEQAGYPIYEIEGRKAAVNY